MMSMMMMMMNTVYVLANGTQRLTVVCLSQAALADISTSPTAYQPGVIYVVQDANSGHVVLPTVTAANPGNGQVNAKDAKETFILHIILSCFVFWLCGFLFGLVAFVLARK